MTSDGFRPRRSSGFKKPRIVPNYQAKEKSYVAYFVRKIVKSGGLWGLRQDNHHEIVTGYIVGARFYSLATPFQVPLQVIFDKDVYSLPSSAAMPAGKSTDNPKVLRLEPNAWIVRKRLCSRLCSPICPIRTIFDP